MSYFHACAVCVCVCVCVCVRERERERAKQFWQSKKKDELFLSNLLNVSTLGSLRFSCMYAVCVRHNPQISIHYEHSYSYFQVRNHLSATSVTPASPSAHPCAYTRRTTWTRSPRRRCSAARRKATCWTAWSARWAGTSSSVRDRPKRPWKKSRG